MQNTEYAIFKDNVIVSPPFRTPAHAMTWAQKKGLCKAVGPSWTPLPRGYDVKPISTVDIDAIYKNKGCCGNCAEHPCPIEKKVVHGLMLAALMLVTSACSTMSMKEAEAPRFAGYTAAHNTNMVVNRMKANGVIRYADRPKGYIPLRVIGAGDTGNCLDFAVLKCSLMAKQVDPSRLSIWAFKRYTGQGHAVCVIDGKYAMDWHDAPINFTPAALGADTNDNQLRQYNVIGVDWKKGE